MARLAQIEPRPPAYVAPGEIELTILMPCLDEAETVAGCVRQALAFLKRTGVAGEVVVVDNGSSDGSQALAARAGARVVLAPEPGYGAALQAGVAQAWGRYVIMGHADGGYDFARLDEMLAALRDGAQLVIGNRFKGGIAPGAMPLLHRYLRAPLLSSLGRLFFRAPIGDFHCGLRGFHRDAVRNLKLQSAGSEFASEMVVKASLHGFAIREVATTLAPDSRDRPPRLRTWRDSWLHLRFLLMHSPRWLFVYPGMVLAAAGLLGVFALIGGQLQLAPGLSFDVNTLTVACFALLMGVQLVVFGALARRYAMVEGFLPSSDRLRRFLLGLTLETLLRGALLVFLAGAAGLAWAGGRWVAAGLEPIGDGQVLRVLILSCTAMCAAVQVAAAGFLGSILTIRRRD